MKNQNRSEPAGYGRAAALGFVTGLRSMMPAALLFASIQRRNGPLDADALPSAARGLLQSRAALVGSGLAACGELVGDKLPLGVRRTDPLPLGGRIIMGSLAGAVVGWGSRINPVAAALLGAAGAVAGSYAGPEYRDAVTKATGTPDLPWALLEDAAAIGLGVAALSGSLRKE